MWWSSGAAGVRNGLYGQFWFSNICGVWNAYTIEAVLTLLQGIKFLVSGMAYKYMTHTGFFTQYNSVLVIEL